MVNMVASCVSSSVLVLVTILAVLGLSAASTFQVGGTDGWSSSKNVNYTNWADKIHFQVGDFIRFVYDNKTENVMQLTQRGFKSCNLTKPANAWSTGNDAVPLLRPGHFYFVSSVDGKCDGSKAKLSVKVFSNDDDESQVPGPVSAPIAAAPAPKHNGAAESVKASVVGVIVLVAAMMVLIVSV